MKLNRDLIKKIFDYVENISDGNINYPLEDYGKEWWENSFQEICDIETFMYHLRYLYNENYFTGRDGYIIDLTEKARNFKV